MNTENFCQSCSMPLINDELLGTEKDGSKNREYCKYCYQDGSFVNPEMSLDEMRSFISKKMKEMNINEAITNIAVNSLPNLKRWKEHDLVDAGRAETI